MAKIEDYINKNEGTKEDKPVEETTSLSDLGTEESTPNQEPKAEETETLPEKYAGKSLAELVRMHQEAESAIGRQGNEMGELRRTVDKLIDANLKPAHLSEDNTEDAQGDGDFFADPVKSVTDLVSKHPDVVKAKETNEKQTKQERQAEILKRHPDVDQVFADPGFREWIEKSPHRKAQLLKADKDFDVDAGDSLLTDYKEIKEAKSAKATTSSQSTTTTVTKPDIKAASTGSVSSGSGGSRTGKVIYRADIRELQRTNPKRYKEMLPAIRKAYAEGRVK